MPRTTFVFGADPMKFLGDWGWVVGQESADGGATACIFCSVVLVSTNLRQTARHVPEIYLMVPHEHKVPRTAYQLLLTLPVL